MPVDGFAAQLIAALEEAQAAASQPKPSGVLAQAAWDKLQFDFPVVSEAELAALADEYAGGKRRGVSARFLAVLREGASAAPAGPSASEAATSAAAAAAGAPNAVSGGGSGSGSGSGLVPMFQRLYALAVLESLLACLDAPEAAAAAQLAGLLPAEAGGGGALFGVEGTSQLEAALAAAAEQQGAAAGDRSELEQRLSQQEDDDSCAYEPLDAAPPAPQPEQQRPASQQAGVQLAAGGEAAALPAQLAELAGHLSYHCMSDAAAWRELRLLQRVAACLAAARRHPRFPELHGVVEPLLRLAIDRLVAVPAEVDAGLPALLDALGVPADPATSATTSSSSGGGPASQVESEAASTAAAELALEAAVALAAQLTAPSARRRLWHEVHQRLLPLAAGQLEQQQVALARQARAAGGRAAGAAGAAAPTQPSAQQLYSIMLACQLLYFFVLQAPPGFAAAAATGGSGSGSRLQEAFLRGGLLRSLVLLFMQLGPQPGAEPLRCALLLTCAAAQPLTDWAAAVPGFAAAAAAPELGPGSDAQLHGALWQALLGGGGGALAALLRDATPAAKVPAIFQALQLMADAQAVARRPLWGGEVAAALRDLAGTLRQHYSKAQQEAEEATSADGPCTSAGLAAGAPDSGDAEREAAAHDAADAAKLAVGAEEQAARLAARRAQQLQPACLKLVKDLLQQGGGAGKHD